MGNYEMNLYCSWCEIIFKTLDESNIHQLNHYELWNFLKELKNDSKICNK